MACKYRPSFIYSYIIGPGGSHVAAMAVLWHRLDYKSKPCFFSKRIDCCYMNTNYTFRCSNQWFWLYFEKSSGSASSPDFSDSGNCGGSPASMQIVLTHTHTHARAHVQKCAGISIWHRHSTVERNLKWGRIFGSRQKQTMNEGCWRWRNTCSFIIGRAECLHLVRWLSE